MDQEFSHTVLGIKPSGIRRAFMQAAGIQNPINLSLGQPFYDALPEVRAAAIDAINNTKSGYGPNIGLPELREKLKSALGYIDESKEFLVTQGVSGGFAIAYGAILNPGDGVLIPDPFFPIYRDGVQLFRGEVQYYDLYPTLSPTIEQVERGWRQNTKVLVLSSPGNPTGVSIQQSELDRIIELCRDRNAWLIYDEIYSELTFDAPHAMGVERYEKGIVLNAFSKSLGVPGWRVGWTVAPKELAEQMLKLQQLLFVCAPTVLQWGVLAGVGRDCSDLRKAFKAKRDFVCERLRDSYDFINPDGSFFLFPKAPGGSGEDFFQRCLKRDLIVVPGAAFSNRDTHFRLSFSASDDVLERGVAVLLDMV